MRTRTLPLYIGGAIGPFCGQLLVSILVVVAASFDITVERAAHAVSAYLAPFAFTMLFSSAVSARFRLDRVIHVAYAVIMAGAILQIFMGSWPLFLSICAVMGTANAFTTPLLQVILKEVVPPEHLATALGTYAAMQSLGMLSSPLVAGYLAQHSNWHLSYALIAVAAAGMLFTRLPPLRLSDAAPANHRITILAVAVDFFTCFALGFGLVGLGSIVSLEAINRFGMGTAQAGLVIAAGGAVSFVFVRFVGALADRIGPRPVLFGALILAILAALALPRVPAVWVLCAVWAVATLCAQAVQMAVNVLVLRSPRGGALISTIQAFRFIGISFAPLVLLPAYLDNRFVAFTASAACLAAALAAQVLRPRRASPGG